MARIVPSLSGAGWIKDPKTIITTMFAHALLSDFSQSTIYYGKVTSIAYLVANYQNNQDEMVAELESILETYYGRVFSPVDISVTYGDVIGGTYKLYVSINATYGTSVYSLALMTAVENNVLSLVIEEINK